MLSRDEVKVTIGAIVSTTLAVLDNSLLWLLCFKTDSDCSLRDSRPTALFVRVNQ